MEGFLCLFNLIYKSGSNKKIVSILIYVRGRISSFVVGVVVWWCVRVCSVGVDVVFGRFSCSLVALAVCPVVFLRVRVGKLLMRVGKLLMRVGKLLRVISNYWIISVCGWQITGKLLGHYCLSVFSRWRSVGFQKF